MKKVLFLVPYPLHIAPGQRFRFEHYLPFFNKNGLTYKIASFLDIDAYHLMYRTESPVRKALILGAGFLKRLLHLIQAFNYDFIFIYREATPLGPPIIEWILVKVLHKKIIYDFDDSIWLKDPNESNLIASLKWKSKVAKICKWSHLVTCGNDFLAFYARRFTGNVRVIPTVINTEYHLPVTKEKSGTPVIGWTGSHSTLVYLQEVLPALRSLASRQDFKFTIIANRDPGFPDEFITFIPWNSKTEIQDLQTFDLGIMPLPNSPWSQGKCGFKLIQYGSIGIPSVASPVGVNSQIVIENETGFLCRTQQEWEEALTKLLTDPGLRKKMGTKAYNLITEHYAVKATTETFLSSFT